MDKEAVVYIHSGILAIKRNTFELVLMRQMNLGANHTEWSKSKEKNKYRILTQIYGIRNMLLMSLFAGLQYREQTSGHRGWDEWREYHGHTHTTICKAQSQRESAVWLGKLQPGLCDNPTGWDSVGGGREAPEGGVACILMADSCCCMAETHTVL